jgi:UDP-sulfoquinovose synthase
VPLTVYGGGGQTRGYLNLRDTLQCVRLAADQPAQSGELRVFNQLTETFTVNELAERVQKAGQQMGIDVAIKSIANPRKEKEEHYYNPVHSGLTELGLEPHYLSETVLGGMLERIVENRHRIDINRIMPRVSWS